MYRFPGKSEDIDFLNHTLPVSSKRYKLACALIEDSDESEHPCSSIRAFDGHSMGSQGSYFSSGRKLRLIRLNGCADRYESSRYTHANLYLMLDTGSNVVSQ